MTASLSLIGHSGDVAAVLLALLERPSVASRLAALLGQSALAGTDIDCLVALAALHDVGKANTGFQRKAFDGPGLRAGHTEPLVALIHFNDTKVWKRLFDEGYLGQLEHLLDTGDGQCHPWQTILAHHGTLPEPKTKGDASLWKPDGDYHPLRASRDLVEAIQLWCPAAFAGQPIAWTHPFAHAFAGLLTLADWIGSDETRFALGHGDEGAERFIPSLHMARRVLAARGLAPEATAAEAASLPRDIRHLTTFARASAAQQAMLDLPPAPPTGRTCLIEDETGSGKTEAALIHFLGLFGAGLVDGMYFALPTRAAARQIHQRIKDALERLLPENAPQVALAVPGYLVGEDGPDVLREGGGWPDAETDARRDRLWASERPKRYLANTVAVGTIDQVLMGGLRVRHAHLRSAAMLRLLLVIDEVHASDPYMTTILRRVLDQHRRSGGHALLMSATLGGAARAALLQPGRWPDVPDEAMCLAQPYPAVWVDSSATPVSARPDDGRGKAVRVVLEPGWADHASVVERAVAAARGGAQVLVIRNTVSSVVATQLALEVAAAGLSLGIQTSSGRVLAPHHARYAPEDRRMLDAALEATLGKNARRVCGSVTIASQTAEQSLDIDADLLITDLCPADVLLQRIGRLHRHGGRARPEGYAEACCVVLAPEERELAATIGRSGEVRGAIMGLGPVYPDLIGVVATRRALAMGTIAIPSDNRRLVEQATHPAGLRSLSETLGGAFWHHWAHVLGSAGAQSQIARDLCIDWHEPIKPHPPPGQALATRLGLDDRLVELPSTMGPFGVKISALTVPGRWVRGQPEQAEPVLDMTECGTVRIAWGNRSFVYDRLGLRPSS